MFVGSDYSGFLGRQLPYRSDVLPKSIPKNSVHCRRLRRPLLLVPDRKRLTRLERPSQGDSDTRTGSRLEEQARVTCQTLKEPVGLFPL